MLFGTLHVFFFFSNGKRFHRARFCSILKSAISGFVSGAETNCTDSYMNCCDTRRATRSPTAVAAAAAGDARARAHQRCPLACTVRDHTAESGAHFEPVAAFVLLRRQRTCANSLVVSLVF